MFRKDAGGAKMRANMRAKMRPSTWLRGSCVLWLATALAASAAPFLAKRVKPEFTLSGKTMTVDGLAVPSERFEERNESAV